METDNYKPNSNRYKEEQKSKEALPEKKIDKVVEGEVKVKKKTALAKMKESFVQEDGRTIGAFIWEDILVPLIKKAIVDAVQGILYNGIPSASPTVSKANKYSYSQTSSVRSRTGYELDDVIFASRGEAEEVLYKMDELIERYRVASVADFYDLAGVTGNYTDNKYGWTDIRSAQIGRVREGWLIRFPKAFPLD